jgi:hypothetical protein
MYLITYVGYEGLEYIIKASPDAQEIRDTIIAIREKIESTIIPIKNELDELLNSTYIMEGEGDDVEFIGYDEEKQDQYYELWDKYSEEHGIYLDMTEPDRICVMVYKPEEGCFRCCCGDEPFKDLKPEQPIYY